MTFSERMKFLRQGLAVRRFHQRYTAQIDTVAAHSGRVAILVTLLNPQAPAYLLRAALYHDLAEGVLGDIPSPAKRAISPAARQDLHNFEDVLLKNHDFFVDLSEADYRLLKMADNMDGLLFCIEERRRGNQEVCEVAETYIRYLHAQIDDNSPYYSTEWLLHNYLVNEWRNADEHVK